MTGFKEGDNVIAWRNGKDKRFEGVYLEYNPRCPYGLVHRVETANGFTGWFHHCYKIGVDQ
jgi:hypothetical protein